MKKMQKKEKTLAIDQPEHYLAIIVEDLRSDFRFVIEKVEGLEHHFQKSIDDLRIEMNQKFSDMETVMDYRFNKVDQKFEQVDLRFEQVDRRFEQVDRRFEQVEGRLENIELRLGNLEQAA